MQPMLRQRNSTSARPTTPTTPTTKYASSPSKRSTPGRYFSENRSPLSSTDSLWDGGQVCYCTGDCQNSLISSPLSIIPDCPLSRQRAEIQDSVLLKFLCGFPLMLSFGFFKFVAVTVLAVVLVLLSILVPSKRKKTHSR